jgi:hypothetical protein
VPDPTRYKATIDSADRKLKDWRERAEQIEKRYEDERAKASRGRKLNLFWSNLEIMKPAVYSRPPAPMIERRFGGADPVARLAAEILTRAVMFFISDEGFDDAMRDARDDWKIAGLGQTWYRYEPVYGDPIMQLDPVTQQPVLDEQGKPVPQIDPQTGQPLRQVAFERVAVEHVRWRDFGYWPLKKWRDVQLVWRVLNLSKEKATATFGAAVAGLLTYDVDPDAEGDDAKGAGAEEGAELQARLIEVWDKQRRTVSWINPKKSGAEAVVHSVKDPLRLQDFFPCPKPLFATLQRKMMVPIPDYYLYQDQAEQIDEITAKISQLIRAVRVRGLYNKAAAGPLKKLLNDTGKTEHMEPVENWPHFAGQQGGIKGNVDFWPLEQIVEALKALIDLRERLKNDMYEASGISDVVRGATDASETLGAQQLKSKYAGLRLQDQQSDIAKHARDGLRIAAEIISEHFQPDTLAMLTGLADPHELENLIGSQTGMGAQMQPPGPPQGMPQGVPQGIGGLAQLLAGGAPAALQGMPPGMPQAAPGAGRPPMDAQGARMMFEEACKLLRGDVMRTFKIDIETDSTVAEAIIADQETVEKLMAAVQRVLTGMAQFIAAPELLPMFKEILLLVIRKYRVGRTIEGKIESAIDDAIAQLKAKPSGPSANPALIKQAATMLQSYKDKLLQMGNVDQNYMQQLESLIAAAINPGGPGQGGAPAPGMPQPGLNGPAPMVNAAAVQ